MQWCSPSLSLPNRFTGLCCIKHKYTRSEEENLNRSIAFIRVVSKDSYQ